MPERKGLPPEALNIKPKSENEQTELKDRFLDNPPLQPKREIAEMLRSRGILVPKIYYDLPQALAAVKKGKNILIRSEHPDEYAGMAGLLDSYTLTQAKIDEAKNAPGSKKITKKDWDKLKEAYNSDPEDAIKEKLYASFGNIDQSTFEKTLAKLSTRKINRHCKLLGIDPEEFLRKVSYSYWEKIPGINRSVIADSAIPGKYHIFSTEGYRYHNYFIIDNGRVVMDAPIKLRDDLKDQVGSVIELYEGIRNSEGFDPNHCPIVELQTNKDKNYFLQYHRTRDMEPSPWELKRPREKDEIFAEFVRGWTPPQGVELEVAMYYPDDVKAYEEEDASFDFHYNFAFAEIMSRRRKANFSHRGKFEFAMHTVDMHLPKSRLFNPPLSVSLDSEKIPRDLFNKMWSKTDKKGEPARIKIRVVSDGRRAYIKFLNLKPA